MPLDVSDPSLTRSQVTAAGIAINAQLRADEARLKAKASKDVLGRLLDAIEKERKRQAAEEANGRGLRPRSESRPATTAATELAITQALCDPPAPAPLPRSGRSRAVHGPW